MPDSMSKTIAPAPAGPLTAFTSSASPVSGPAECPWPRSQRSGILTPRLRLRPFVPADHEALHGILIQAETFAFSDLPAPAPEESWARLLRHIGHWDVLGFGMFAVELRATGKLIGEVGLADFHRGFSDEFDNAPEASWTIDAAHWGRGYAEEAARAAHIWLCRDCDGDPTVCMIHPDNARSLSLAAKLGYREFAQASHRNHPVILLRRNCPDAYYQELLNCAWGANGRGSLPG